MRPHFKRFFRSMAQKDLLLSDACLPFCGHSLLFFCRRFLFQIKRKCRNAGSIYCLIMVCSEGRNQLATIQPYYNFVSASPISDSRKGCPYEVRGLKFVRILKGERSSPLRSAKRAFSKSSCRCRGIGASRSPHPTSCSPIKSCKLRGVDGIPISRTYSLFTLRADDIRPYLL